MLHRNASAFFQNGHRAGVQRRRKSMRFATLKRCGVVLAFAAALATLMLAAVHAAPAPAPGVTDHSILIGQSAPRSGPSKELGEESELGIRLYFESVNARGG